MSYTHIFISNKLQFLNMAQMWMNVLKMQVDAVRLAQIPMAVMAVVAILDIKPLLATANFALVGNTEQLILMLFISSVCYTTEIAHVRFAETDMHQSLYIRHLALYRLLKTCAPSALSDKS